jgi:tetratricopeptide (TPR) repeat protein
MLVQTACQDIAGLASVRCFSNPDSLYFATEFGRFLVHGHIIKLTMKFILRTLVLLSVLGTSGISQVPSVQLLIKEKSGFLGLGGPRVIRLELSTESGLGVPSSDAIQAGRYLYFLVRPAGDWKLSPSFIAEDLTTLAIAQNDRWYPPVWTGDVEADSTTSVLLGFPKTIRIERPFSFAIHSGDSIRQVEMRVPEAFWPGYRYLTETLKNAETAQAKPDFLAAIAAYEQIILRSDLDIFPRAIESRQKRTDVFAATLGEVKSRMQSLGSGDPATLKQRMTALDGLYPLIAFVSDSLPRPAWGIAPTDPPVKAVLDDARNTRVRLSFLRDSLQTAYDDLTIRWILEGSTTGKNGYLYQAMIETLGAAFASLSPADTASGALNVRLSSEYSDRLVKFNLTESYDTFLRICTERLRRREPLFPPDFLPNLRKDSLAFSLPYYDMLLAIEEYYTGSLSGAREVIRRIVRTCDDPVVVLAFDRFRVFSIMREQWLSPDVSRLLDEADRLELARDTIGATERYRQLTLVAPTLAYGYEALGRFYLRINDVIRAQFALQRAYQLDTLFLSAYGEAAELAFRQNNFKAAVEVLNTALAKGNDCWYVHYSLGRALLADGDAARATVEATRAIALNPRSYTSYVQLGLAYQTAKNYKKAREAYNAAVGIDPTRQEAVDRLSKLNEIQKSAR